jgi:hypothetical protein
MHVLIGVIAIIGVSALMVAIVAGIEWASFRFPRFARFLDAEGRTLFPGYTQRDSDITPEYRDEIPGWDDKP